MLKQFIRLTLDWFMISLVVGNFLAVWWYSS